MIYESGLVTSNNSDLLGSGSRLNAIPYNGVLTLEFLSSLADQTNNWTLTIQKPNGDVPVDGQLVPGAGSGLAGVLHTDELLRLSFEATQGGHFTITLTEFGTAVCAYRAVLRP